MQSPLKAKRETVLEDKRGRERGREAGVIIDAYRIQLLLSDHEFSLLVSTLFIFYCFIILITFSHFQLEYNDGGAIADGAS